MTESPLLNVEVIVVLPNRLRDLREDADLLQKEIADYLNCTQACYSFYETGERDIPTQVLIRLATYYGVSIDYLLGQTDNPERNK